MDIGLKAKTFGVASWGFRGLYRVVRDARDGLIKVIGDGL